METGRKIDADTPATEQVSSESKPESSKDTKDKKKKAGTLGLVAVEAPPRRLNKEEAPERPLFSAPKPKSKPERATSEDTPEALAERYPLPELSEKAPTDSLEPAEKQVAAVEFVSDLRVAEAANELPVETEGEGDEQVYVERFRDKIIIENKSPEQAGQEVIAEVAATSAEAADNTPADDDQETVIDPRQLGEGEWQFNQSAETTQENDAEAPEPDDNSGSGGSGKSGSTPPPPPPFGPTGGGRPFAERHDSPAARPTSSTGETARMVSEDDAYYYERKALQRGLVSGLLVGYFLGRRRGRIKTEKKLLPVQEKLHKQVKQLQTEIVHQETAIRKAVRAHTAPRSESSPPPRRTEGAPEHRLPTRQVAPEANQLHTAGRPLERIGQVLIAAEMTPRTVQETGASRSSAETKSLKKTEKMTIQREVQSMTRAELLETSEKIVVDNTSLRQVYETHLIGEHGLRRLVAEHLSGGDVKRQLRRELVEREIDFERDPILRDRARSSVGGGGKAAIDNLLQRAGANLDDDAVAEKVVLKARAAHETAVAASQQRRRRIIDVSFGAFISLLVVLIIILLAMRH